MQSSFMWESKFPHFRSPSSHRDKSFPDCLRRPCGFVMGTECNAARGPKPVANTMLLLFSYFKKLSKRFVQFEKRW